ncbi:glycosyltransferase family 61 protein [Fodinicurvata sp. EGI_FJ10296]|uniref:glycosyltransferase family 61 protein n=1 Tax=Fodinicurvata sp. EGI_FJ10296 TaxID=3231908 RepID=UPI0034523D1C
MLNIDGVVRPLLRPVKKRALQAYERFERNMFGHPDSHWMEAPPNLSSSMIGKDTGDIRFNQFPNVQHYIRRPGILRMEAVSLAGLVTNTHNDPKDDKKYTFGLVDKWGFPLSYIYGGRGWKEWRAKVQIGPILKTYGRRPTVALLGRSFATNYFHWLTDVVGDYWFLKKAGFNIDDVDLYVCPGGDEKWQQEIFSIIGIPDQKRISIKNIGTIHGIDAIIPYRSKASSEVIPTWISTALREQIGHNASQNSSRRLLYLSRKDARRRKVVNESCIIESLKAKGFIEVQCEGMTIKEQQQLFGCANTIIAAHGAALTNIIWCNKNTNIIDILPERKKTPCFNILSIQCNLNYNPIWTKSIKTYKQQEHWDDIEITPAAVDQIMKFV